MSLRRPFGDLARAVDLAPLFPAPLFRPDGILGRVRAQIPCTRLTMRSRRCEDLEGKP